MSIEHRKASPSGSPLILQPFRPVAASLEWRVGQAYWPALGLTLAEQARSMNPVTSALVHNVCGEALYLTGRKDEARAACLRALNTTGAFRQNLTARLNEILNQRDGSIRV